MFDELLERLGIEATNSGVCGADWHARPGGSETASVNPSTGEAIARVQTAARGDYDQLVEGAGVAFERWRALPAPSRGEIVRQLGLALRSRKRDLGLLLSLEVGKTRSEGEGEVQEMIDMCDFATGLSRQLHGLTIASERPLHRLMEQWHPLGPIGVITAFNFPVAVWAWNATLAAVCGDTVIWKPSPEAPLSAIAVQHIANSVMAEHGQRGVFNLCCDASAEVGQWLAADKRLPLISATGSCAMGRYVAARVGHRLGRTLLELSGNNGMIVTEDANLDMALRAVVFAAVGTTGQRCTTLRRLFVQESIIDDFVNSLVAVYRDLPIGDPWEDGVLVGPLINAGARERMLSALEEARAQGGAVLCGGTALARARLLRHAGHRACEPGHADRGGGNVRADPVRDELRGPRRCDCREQRGRSGPLVGDLHGAARGCRAVPVGGRQRLRNCERQSRHVGC